MPFDNFERRDFGVDSQIDIGTCISFADPHERRPLEFIELIIDESDRRAVRAGKNPE